MFLSYYKAETTGVEQGQVRCLFGRSSLRTDNKSIGFKNQILVPDENGNFMTEGDRLLGICNNQNLIDTTNAIDSDIAIYSRSMIKQMLEYKIANPQEKVSMIASVKKYTADTLMYLDWLDQWVALKDIQPEFIGFYYILYKVKKGNKTEYNHGTFEVLPDVFGG